MIMKTSAYVAVARGGPLISEKRCGGLSRRKRLLAIAAEMLEYELTGKKAKFLNSTSRTI